MFRSKIIQEKALITEFHGHPDKWGSVVRTIKSTLGDFTCMTTIGHRIAAACGDGTVGIYDSVTGVLRLSLNPVNVVEAMRGFPDGSILSCMHRDSPSITLWDIQTGGLIHTFTLEREPKDIAISSKGRYLACGLSDGSVEFWEITDGMGGRAFGSGPPITHLCWLAPEERLTVASGASVHIWDVVTERVLHSFEMRDPVHGAAYSQKSNQLAIMTRSGVGSAIDIIDPQTGTCSHSYGVKMQLSCLAFSQATEELVCGIETHGLQLFNASARRWRHFDHPARISSVSTLSNGIVVANAAGLGIQLLSLDEGYATSRQLDMPALAVRHLGEDGVVAVVPTELDRFILVELATMSQVHTIPTQGNHSTSTDRTVLCASLGNKMAVYCFEEGDKANVQSWKFGGQLPAWTVDMDELPSICRISPTGAWFVTSGTVRGQTHIRVWDAKYGFLTSIKSGVPPLDITFSSGDIFHIHYQDFCFDYTIGSSTIRRRELPLAGQTQERQYRVDNSHEWVISGSERICWIPPEYTSSSQASHCWAGSSLVMVGQDGTLRKLTFREH